MLKKRVSLILSLALLLPACGGSTPGKNIGKPVNPEAAAAVYDVGVSVGNLASGAGAVATGAGSSIP